MRALGTDAALRNSKVDVPTLDGATLTVTVPAGASSPKNARVWSRAKPISPS